mmetsp:Transcript_6639/g.14541  ORF Transcript_6639/g.14541 Transcript_6639/m.14541 type:complete len:260 (-) Transcript_6639:1472-2251(-)
MSAVWPTHAHAQAHAQRISQGSAPAVARRCVRGLELPDARLDCLLLLPLRHEHPLHQLHLEAPVRGEQRQTQLPRATVCPCPCPCPCLCTCLWLLIGQVYARILPLLREQPLLLGQRAQVLLVARPGRRHGQSGVLAWAPCATHPPLSLPLLLPTRRLRLSLPVPHAQVHPLPLPLSHGLEAVEPDARGLLGKAPVGRALSPLHHLAHVQVSRADSSLQIFHPLCELSHGLFRSLMPLRLLALPLRVLRFRGGQGEQVA